jgi:two-component system cell cycle response regulator
MLPESSVNVLLVDDDELYREHLAHQLERHGGFTMQTASNSATMLEIMENRHVDCLVLDYNLGVETALSIGELIKKNYADPPPIVMLTGEGKERTVVKAFRGGFSDYVSKRNMKLDELVGAIRDAVARKQQERVEREERDRLARFSDYDGRTGLHAGGFVKKRAEEMALSSGRRGAPYALIVIRLQKLDSIGDKFGYVVRDKAMRAFAARLQRAARETDFCGRHTEDSFLYLIDRNANPQTVVQTCQRLTQDLSFEVNFDNVCLTLSARIGAAIFPRDGMTVDHLLTAAGDALAQAQSGEVAFAIASPPSDAGTLQHAPPAANGYAATADIRSIESGPNYASRQVDRRRERRQRVLKLGKILVNGLGSVIDCKVRDLSAGGARLRMENYFAPPEQFELLFVDSGARRMVKTRWRVDNDIGVEFVA